jgi:hypothetical protein
MKIDITSVNSKEVLSSLSKFKLKTYRIILHRGIAKWMEEVKFDSAKEILPKSKLRSPSGRLTNRSGRLSWMLREEGRHGVEWKGIGSRQASTMESKSKSFYGAIKESTSHDLSAWWSVYIRDGSVGLKNYRGRLSVSDLKKSLAFRAMHERGLKGNAPRQFLMRTAIKIQGKLYPYMQEQFVKYKDLI